MTDLSNRQHDAFDNPAKMACRQGSLRVPREAGYRGFRRTGTTNAKPMLLFEAL